MSSILRDPIGWSRKASKHSAARLGFLANGPGKSIKNWWANFGNYPSQRPWWTAGLIGLGILVPSMITTPLAVYLTARTVAAVTYPAIDKVTRPAIAAGLGRGYRPLSNGSTTWVSRPTQRELDAGQNRLPTQPALHRIGADPAAIPPRLDLTNSQRVIEGPLPLGAATGERTRGTAEQLNTTYWHVEPVGQREHEVGPMTPVGVEGSDGGSGGSSDANRRRRTYVFSR